MLFFPTMLNAVLGVLLLNALGIRMLGFLRAARHVDGDALDVTLRGVSRSHDRGDAHPIGAPCTFGGFAFGSLLLPVVRRVLQISGTTSSTVVLIPV